MSSESLPQNTTQSLTQLNELGVLAARSGRYSIAIDCFRQALNHRPDDAALKKNLALAIYASGDQQAASSLLCELAEEHPKDLDHLTLAASTLQAQDRYHDAILLYERVRKREGLPINEASIRVSIHYAAALRRLGRPDEALAQINEVRPFFEAEDGIVSVDIKLEFFTNRANIHFDLCQWSESVSGYKHALAIDSNDPIIHSNLGCALQEIGDYALAIEHHRKALAIDPNSRTVKWNYANTLLLNQQWSLGWLYYEARPSQDLKPPAIIDAMPRWTPGDDPARTVLVLVSEQGIGDFVFFARFAEMAKARCASMVFYVEPPLAELAHDLNLEAYVCTSADELAAIQARLDDYMFRKIPMGSLALAFHDPTLAPVGQSAYLSPAVYLRRKFSETQAKLPINMAGLPTVGLAWRGSPKHKRDRIRSILLAELLEYLPQPAQYVALYPEVSATESELLNKHGVQSYGCEIANIASTLALISTMHLVIAVDTSLAHLSAAQGKPTWILLPKACDWRWGTDPNKTLWYNHARLFRQTRHSDWSAPLSRLKASLVDELQTISQPTF